ncbi:hypothetical protein K9B35_16535 [Sphingomonas sp. R647]|uniref:hypothetical protein n=1 Tax=Sphingomonas sp. R647 TaxID=2875233 RepID=UPI001CD4FD58|nr:hypothetical protein [Sphingomonas sp. R647]MCA1199577.1 hypothetical protein [Sphingomonas sp. R647]
MKPVVPVAVIALTLAGCGDPAPRQGNPTAAQAAASGVAEVVQSAAKGNPFPRDKLPDFVETYDGGRYLTSFFGSNVKRDAGTLLYDAPAAPAKVIAFHVASMEKFGFSASAPETRVVRKRNETSIEGKHPDGRVLNMVVIEQSPDNATVHMNFAVPKS